MYPVDTWRWTQRQNRILTLGTVDTLSITPATLVCRIQVQTDGTIGPIVKAAQETALV